MHIIERCIRINNDTIIVVILTPGASIKCEICLLFKTVPICKKSEHTIYNDYPYVKKFE